jgi:hypothetical protein
LALARHTRYVYEPFNSQTGLACIQDRFPVPGSNGFPLELLDECVERIRTLNMNLKRGVLARDAGWRRLFKTYIGSRTRLSYLMCRFDFTLNTIIWKDPLAALAAEAVASRHKMPIVVTVRPPMAVAASFKRMGWTPPVAEVNRRLTEVGVDSANEYIHRYGDSLNQSSIASVILWRMVYSMLLRALTQSDTMYFVNVQDFIDRPVERYRHLYNILELPWSHRVEAGIDHRHAGNQCGRTKMEQMPQRAHVGKRNLREINEYGRKLLSPEEISSIEDVTDDIWPAVQAACLRWPERVR